MERTITDGVNGIQANSFYLRSARMWNELPAKVVDVKTLNSFKNALDKHWEEAPMKYDHKKRDEERFAEDMQSS